MICKYCGKEISDNSEYCEFCNESLIDKIVLDDKALIRAKENRRREESPIFVRAYYKAKDSSEERKLRKTMDAGNTDPSDADEMRTGDGISSGGKNKVKIYTGEPFYKKKQARMLAVILSALPIIMIVLSIFLNWRYYIIYSNKEIKQSKTMKEIVSSSISKDPMVVDQNSKTFANYVPLICMIMLLVAALYILYMAVVDIFPEKKFPGDHFLKKWGFMVRVVPVVLIITAIVIFVHCKMYERSLKEMMDYHRGFSSLIGYEEKSKPVAGKGLGHFLACASPFMYVVSKVYSFVINTLNEDD